MPENKILVIRGGAIGDFILTLPVLAALRRQFPESRLEVLFEPVPDGTLNHVGPRVPSAGMLVQIQTRLEAAGIRTQREEGVECCHST